MTIINVILWSFAPPMISAFVLNALHSLAPSPPPRGSPQWSSQYRAVTILVISLYLVYTLYAADREVAGGPPNFYRLLEVPLNVASDDSALRRAYKKASIKYHPDKAGKESEVLYMVLKTAYDTLSVPEKKFAYDRFGTDSLDWKDCQTYDQFVSKGLWNLFMWYSGTGVMILGLRIFRQFDGAKFWRFYCLVAMFVFEALMITRPHGVIPSWLQYREMLPFELSSLARKFMLTIFMAFNQLAPIIRNRPGQGIKVTDPEFNTMTTALAQTADRVDNLANSTVAGSLLPFKYSIEDVDAIQESLRKEFVDKFVIESVEKMRREKVYDEVKRDDAMAATVAAVS